jgi:hypothetical protein
MEPGVLGLTMANSTPEKRKPAKFAGSQNCLARVCAYGLFVVVSTPVVVPVVVPVVIPTGGNVDGGVAIAPAVDPAVSYARSSPRPHALNTTRAATDAAIVIFRIILLLQRGWRANP